MRIARGVLLVILLGYVGVVFYLTHTPLTVPIGPQMNDKIAHFLAYFGLGTLLYLALWAIRPSWVWIFVVVMLGAMGYGALDELTQPLAGRTCDIVDWMADVAGAATAVTGLGLIHALTYRRLSASTGSRRP